MHHIVAFRFRIAVMALMAATLATIAFSQQPAQSGPIRLTGKTLQIEMDKSGGMMSAFLDKTSGLNFVSASGLSAPLWKIDMLPGTAPASITPQMAGNFRWERVGNRRVGLTGIRARDGTREASC